MADPSLLLAAVHAESVSALKRALDAKPESVAPRVMVDAARRAWQPGLAVLKKYGGDLNSCYRHYRPCTR